MRMLEWIARGVVGVVFGRGILAAINAFGYAPERWVAEMLVKAIPIMTAENSIWMLAGIFAVAFWIWDARSHFIEGISPSSKRPFGVWTWHLTREDAWPYLRLIPLNEGAKIVYQNTLNTRASRAAETPHNGESIVLHWYGTQMLNHGGLRIYGRRSHQSRLEKIAAHILREGGHLTHNATQIRRLNVNDPIYVDLMMLRRDIPSQINAMKNTWPD